MLGYTLLRKRAKIPTQIATFNGDTEAAVPLLDLAVWSSLKGGLTSTVRHIGNLAFNNLLEVCVLVWSTHTHNAHMDENGCFSTTEGKAILLAEYPLFGATLYPELKQRVLQLNKTITRQVEVTGSGAPAPCVRLDQDILPNSEDTSDNTSR